MEQWIYPIGRFVKPATTSDDEREQRVRAVSTAPAALRAAVEGLTGQQLDTPYREGGWTARQVAHHTTDAAMTGYTRFKLALTEDNPTVKTFEENAWAALPDSIGLEPEVSLLLFESLQTRFDAVLRELPAESFSRPFLHPANGEMTIDQLLAYFAWHGHHHAAQIATLRNRMGW
ncbi:YfiT family bacillithiol transferase [Cohnella faecalis]|uniref:Putative metal-dependent hydrolase n=1 Tax=Cohnella faecalis TaxID=2315694 RepID=A0A398CQI6_9BACL|nr:putative metal-dependent hydrolase [Cohnella faecalis]RIE03058.1 putative metal-dependent hydrolase [Cohnella faecalis]